MKELLDFAPKCPLYLLGRCKGSAGALVEGERKGRGAAGAEGVACPSVGESTSSELGGSDDERDPQGVGWVW